MKLGMCIIYNTGYSIGYYSALSFEKLIPGTKMADCIEVIDITASVETVILSEPAKPDEVVVEVNPAREVLVSNESSNPVPYKIRICKFAENCERGANCTFLHKGDPNYEHEYMQREKARRRYKNKFPAESENINQTPVSHNTKVESAGQDKKYNSNAVAANKPKAGYIGINNSTNLTAEMLDYHVNMLKLIPNKSGIDIDAVDNAVSVIKKTIKTVDDFKKFISGY